MDESPHWRLERSSFLHTSTGGIWITGAGPNQTKVKDISGLTGSPLLTSLIHYKRYFYETKKSYVTSVSTEPRVLRNVPVISRNVVSISGNSLSSSVRGGCSDSVLRGKPKDSQTTKKSVTRTTVCVTHVTNRKNHSVTKTQVLSPDLPPPLFLRNEEGFDCGTTPDVV